VNSLTEENYLKALYHLTLDKGTVNVKELALYFGIKMPTVTSMIKRLSTKQLVHYESYKPLKLTDLGYKTAALIVRKHRLTEMFLVQKMGLGWEHVHDIAEQIEHIQSPLFFEKMDELLGFPTMDPHGSPIPDKNGRINPRMNLKLSECQVGQRVVLVAMLNDSSDFIKILNAKKLQLGQILQILSIQEFDKTMTLSYADHPAEMISHVVCQQLLVEHTEIH